MTYGLNSARPCSPRRLGMRTHVAQIRTKPNNTERLERPSHPKIAGESRKNLKKPESPKPTISRKTLGIEHPNPLEKKDSPKPENRCSPALTPLPRNVRQTAKTAPKLRKTATPVSVFSSNTLGICTIWPATEKFHDNLSTPEIHL